MSKLIILDLKYYRILQYTLSDEGAQKFQHLSCCMVTILKKCLHKSFPFQLTKVIRAVFLGCMGTVRPKKTALMPQNLTRPRVLTICCSDEQEKPTYICVPLLASSYN